MKVIPYASVIGSIKYAMLYTRPIVYLALSLAKYSFAKLRARYTIGLVYSIAYFIEPMTEAQGMTFILFSIFCRGRDLSLTQFHTLAA